MNCRNLNLLTTLIVLTLPLGLHADDVADTSPLDFNRDVRPILSDKCFFCHGPDAEERSANLRLDIADGATGVIVPGKPDASELVARIRNPDDPMPPADSHKKLNPNEIALLTRWVAEGGQYDAPWAYIPPKKHAVPETEDKGWAENWVDQFILAKLDSEKLAPSPDADPITLVRRLSFDLTGLPPTSSQIDAFLSGQLDYDRLVNELLGSPRFGERMAVYWLDLVRYADTVGYHGDQDHLISPYRDYVIRSFNQNLPFDQFTREQLAGDLLDNPTKWQKVATGYNRLLQTSHEGGVQAKEYNAIYAADRVRNLSAVWMGATVGCAQCHDHKYDPYTIRDHYSLSAFFADIHDVGYSGNSLPTSRPPEMEFQSRRTMITVAKPPRETRVLPRGNWQDDSGEVVTSSVPAFLGEISLPEDQRATRLDLANWLTDSTSGVGGLTARVFANRFWYLFFGSGISRSLSDFGGQGEPPANPALLDNLAVEFYESGWDVKAMVRLIVTSHTYRQTSVASPELLQRDPSNQLVARQSRFRLPAEMIRDNALEVSGLLVEQLGGASVKPYQPTGYFRHLNFPVRKYESDRDANQWRRGLYVHWQRMFLHPMMKAMNAPSREECTAQRPKSNTPNAALVLLNDPTFIEAARVLAIRILREGGDRFDNRIELAYRTVLSRSPDSEERDIVRSLLEETESGYQRNPEAASKLIEIGISHAPRDMDPVELASWTSVARALLNLSETVTRN